MRVLFALVLSIVVGYGARRFLLWVSDAGVAADRRRQLQARLRQERLDALHLRPCTVWWQPVVTIEGNPPPYFFAVGLVAWAPCDAACQASSSGRSLL